MTVASGKCRMHVDGGVACSKAPNIKNGKKEVRRKK